MRMKLRNKIFGLMAVTVATLTVAGCSPSAPPSVSTPITVEETAYSAFHVMMDNGLIRIKHSLVSKVRKIIQMLFL